MRVLQAMAGAPLGGAEAFFERLVPALQRAGLEQRVLIRRDPGRAARLRAHGIEPVELRFGGLLDFSTRAAFRREIARFRPEIVMTWMNRASRMCPAGDFVHVGRLGGYYDLKYYRRCDHLVANTADIRRHLVAAGWPPERAHHLPNFVDATPSPPVSRDSLGVPAGAPLLLALGRLHANKGFDVLLKAMARLPQAWLAIAGEGPEGRALAALAAAEGVAGRVRFLGWRHDVAALLAAADALVCPSRHEPLGNVVIEGWAHFRPVVAAAASGPAALVRDGETGLLVPVEDADALARALARVSGEPGLGARLARAGRKAYEAAFTERAVVARYLAFFGEAGR